MNPAQSLEELLQLESHLETGFEGYIASTGFMNVFRSRGSASATVPRIELWVTIGAVANHQHIFPDQRFTWDAWSATLNMEVVTERLADSRRGDHVVMLGKVRAILQLFRIQPVWSTFSQWIRLSEIKEGGTLDSWEDEHKTDHTTIQWTMLINVHPEAWPVNIDS